MQELGKEQYLQTKKNIRYEMDVATESFVKIGYYLKQVRDNKWYRQENFIDIYDFAKETFHIERSTASRFMSINDKYSVGGNSIEIQKEFEGFGSSKLIEMLHMPEDLITEIPTTATVKEIREIKNKMLPEEKEEEQLPGQMSVCDVSQMELSKKNWMKAMLKEFFLKEGKEVFEDVFETIKRPVIFGTETVEQQVRILIAPSKFRFYRMAEANVMFNESRFSIMPRGEDKEEHTYRELIDCFEEMFQGEDAERSYYEVYEEKLEQEPVGAVEEKKDDIPSIEENIEEVEEETEEKEEIEEEFEEDLEVSNALENYMNEPVCDVAQKKGFHETEQLEVPKETDAGNESEESQELEESQRQQDIHTEEGIHIIPKSQTRFAYLKSVELEDWIPFLSEVLVIDKEEIREWLQEEVDA
ncbi:hypothetical protein [Anaerosacchariphilus polymeriproducens]|uniref:Uncharacterized protein n=1 Tax=Anaerosacchariphilus polymeriproducens TaxID=1812858 RepID=A0A371ARJ1_9FIRM|nr:hypothetical protein [Anaerosacchariphilus polymeriproducens]RDU22189.1 hypothetical protein DWV06_16820 [Anaerosacchariphilus polymeriproducens]